MHTTASLFKEDAGNDCGMVDVIDRIVPVS